LILHLALVGISFRFPAKHQTTLSNLKPWVEDAAFADFTTPIGVETPDHIDDGDLGLALRDVAEVKPGMFLWMNARAGHPGFISVVQSVNARSDLVVAQLLNTSEVDPELAAAFTQRTGARSYPGLEQLIDGGDRGQYPELHNPDIVTSGLPW
jgi:hypothetical protein